MQSAPLPNAGASVSYTAANVALRFMAQDIRPDFPSRSDTVHYTRCEVGRTLRGGECELPGETLFMGALLCARHARQAELYQRIDLLHAVVLSSELSLQAISLRRDRRRALLLRRQRGRAARELDLAYEDLRRFEGNAP